MTAPNTVASSLVAMAVKRAAELEKTAQLEKEANRFMKILGALGAAGKTIDRGAGGLLRGLGGIASGAGYAGRAVGIGAQAAGAGGQRFGNTVLKNVTRIPNRIAGTNAGGVARDVGRVAGHAAGGLGAATSLVGKATKFVGETAGAAGKGLNYLSNIPGLRTVAAAPVVAGGAIAAKPFLPDVNFQNPVDAKMPGWEYQPGRFELRNPVQLSWGR